MQSEFEIDVDGDAVEARFEAAREVFWSGDDLGALSAMTAVLRDAERCWGESDPRTIRMLRFALWIRHWRGADEETMAQHEVHLSRLADAQAPSTVVLAARKQRAIDLRTVRGPATARAEFVTIHRVAVFELGELHYETLDVEEELAFTVGLTGDLAGADERYRALLRTLDAADGAHAVRLSTLRTLALQRWVAGYERQPSVDVVGYERALRTRLAALANRSPLDGRGDDPAAALARHDLAHWLRTQGRDQEARRAAERIAPAEDALTVEPTAAPAPPADERGRPDEDADESADEDAPIAPPGDAPHAAPRPAAATADAEEVSAAHEPSPSGEPSPSDEPVAADKGDALDAQPGNDPSRRRSSLVRWLTTLRGGAPRP